ncbi:MAG: thiamine pyrophosphate-dependent dehydrogenase E1 component subunit alpha [Bdellovibrionota bacterium]
MSEALRIPAQPFKDKNFSLAYYKHMARARALEERLIKMMRSGDGYFWIGGPGEEAFSVALALQVRKGQGVAFDYLHLHYRSNPIALTMGAPMIDFVRQMKSTASDPFSGGRNFVAHICKKEWNIVPVTSTIETQFAVAPGTAMAQRRARLKNEPAGVTIVIGGDAGTAEGDFASCLIWSTRPGTELPMLIIATNNKYGISTSADTQHGEKNIADRARAFGMSAQVVDGNNPEKIWGAIETALDTIRSTGKPYFLEVMVSRLHGHSSSSGAARVTDELCCIDAFEKKLLKSGWTTEKEIEQIKQTAHTEAQEAHEKVKAEPLPEGSTFQIHSFANGERGGVPGRDF